MLGHYREIAFLRSETIWPKADRSQADCWLLYHCLGWLPQVRQASISRIKGWPQYTQPPWRDWFTWSLGNSRHFRHPQNSSLLLTANCWHFEHRSTFQETLHIDLGQIRTRAACSKSSLAGQPHWWVPLRLPCVSERIMTKLAVLAWHKFLPSVFR